MSTTTYEDKINQMYDSQLNSQKEQLTQDYTKADSDLTAQKDKLQKQTDAQLRRTAVDAQKAKINTAEYHAANGLSTGARAQARLALENQLQADLAALRTAQQEADAETERQRGLLSQEYAALIRKAQADNDFQRAQALYQEAKDADAKLLARQEAAAGIMAQAGDYTRYGELYGLTPEEIKKLRKQSSGGSTRRVIDDIVFDEDPVATGNLSEDKIKMIQWQLGVDVTGVWDQATMKASGYTDSDKAYDAWNKGRLGNTNKNAMQTNIWLANGQALANRIQNKTPKEQLKEIENAYNAGKIDYVMLKELLGMFELV